MVEGTGPRVLRRLFCVMLMACVTLAPVVAAQGDQTPASNDYAQGKVDGEKDAKGNALWILSGVLLGPIGLILPWIFGPTAPASRLVGKSADYVDGYTDGYKKKARPKNFLYSLGGLGITATVVLVGIGVVAARTAQGVATGCGNSAGEGCGNAIGSGCSPSISPSCGGIPVAANLLPDAP